jgi:hypothetical protein
MFIYNTFTIIKTVINRAHCNRILQIRLSQISLSSHILYLGMTALTALEPSIPIKPHYPVPLSLCRWTLAAPLQPLSPVSTTIVRWWSPGSLTLLPLCRRDMAPSSSAHCLVVILLSRDPLTASPWLGSLAIRTLPRCDLALSPSAHCLDVTWLPRLPHTASPWLGYVAIRSLIPREIASSSSAHWLTAFSIFSLVTTSDNAFSQITVQTSPIFTDAYSFGFIYPQL